MNVKSARTFYEITRFGEDMWDIKIRWTGGVMGVATSFTGALRYVRKHMRNNVWGRTL